jgi:hypothetical protein
MFFPDFSKLLAQARMIGLRSQALGYGFMRMSLALTQGYRARKPFPFPERSTHAFHINHSPLVGVTGFERQSF